MPATSGKSGFWTSVAVLVGALALADGGLVMGEGSDEPQAAGPRELRGRTVENLVEEVEDTVPGFAGMFVDEAQDVLYVYSVDQPERVRAAAEAAMAAVFGDRPPVSRIEVLPARYAFPRREERRLGPEVPTLDSRKVVEGRFFELGTLASGFQPRSRGTLAFFLDLA